MKFSISKSALLPELAQLAKISDGKVVPLLGDILFSVYDGVLVMEAGDGVISMKVTVEGVKITKTGAATIPAKKLHEIVKKIGDTIELESVGNWKTKLTSGKSKYELSGQDPVMYPTLQKIEGDELVISGKVFKDIIKRTEYAVSVNENEIVIRGLRLVVRASKLTSTGCDRHRLSEASCTLKSGFTDVQSVVSGASLKELLTVIPDSDITIIFGESIFSIQAASTVINLRVFEGTYPDTTRLIPVNVVTDVKLIVKDFKDAIERALIVALADKTNIIKLQISENEVHITAVTEMDKASETVEATLRGNPMTISFNGKYMVQALATIEDEEFMLCLSGVMNPIILRTVGEDDFQLVLPYRTQN
jgi:DNA polymerase-3 subunit beta